MGVVCAESKQWFRGSVTLATLVCSTRKKRVSKFRSHVHQKETENFKLCRARNFESLNIESTYNFRYRFCDFTHPHYMRSFNKSTEKYTVQYEYNTKKDSMADVHLPACQLRLMNLTGIESEGSIDRPNSDLVKRDGFFHMNACNEALNALDRCGWKRSYHQSTFKHPGIITNKS